MDVHRRHPSHLTCTPRPAAAPTLAHTYNSATAPRSPPRPCLAGCKKPIKDLTADAETRFFLDELARQKAESGEPDSEAEGAEEEEDDDDDD
jgi:hypothetical protein